MVAPAASRMPWSTETLVADGQPQPAPAAPSRQASAVMAATRSASSWAAAAGTTIRAITRTVPTASTAATTTSAMSRFRTRSRTPVR